MKKYQQPDVAVVHVEVLDLLAQSTYDILPPSGEQEDFFSMEVIL